MKTGDGGNSYTDKLRDLDRVIYDRFFENKRLMPGWEVMPPVGDYYDMRRRLTLQFHKETMN